MQDDIHPTFHLPMYNQHQHPPWPPSHCSGKRYHSLSALHLLPQGHCTKPPSLYQLTLYAFKCTPAISTLKRKEQTLLSSLYRQVLDSVICCQIYLFTSCLSLNPLQSDLYAIASQKLIWEKVKQLCGYI